MLNNNIFYHKITRNVIVAFGSLFSGIKITRKNQDESVEQTIAVPIAYSGKEKWIVRLEQDPSAENQSYITLPRLAFEVTGYSYDAARKTNRSSYITCSDGTTMSKVFAPVPYNIDISLYALAKTTEDGLQIIEQILPFFTPEFTMGIKAVPESNIVMDVPIVLNSVSFQDDYDGDFQTRRFVTYTMNFTLKAWMFGPVQDQGIINRVNVDLTGFEKLQLDGDPTTGDMTFTWTDTEDLLP